MSDATVVHLGPRPAPETHQDRLNRCRPRDDGAQAIADAIAAAKRELEASLARIEREQNNRRQNLQYGTVEQIQQNDKNIGVLVIEHEQFSFIVERLTLDLATAQANEQEDGIYLQSLADAVAEPAAAFQKWLDNVYTKHARAIAEGLKLADAMNQAVAALNAARHTRPRVPRPNVCEIPAFNGDVVLPGVNGGPDFVMAPETQNPRVPNLNAAYA